MEAAARQPSDQAVDLEAAQAAARRRASDLEEALPLEGALAQLARETACLGWAAGRLAAVLAPAPILREVEAAPGGPQREALQSGAEAGEPDSQCR